MNSSHASHKRSPTELPSIIVINGPTASGKSDLAIQFAKKYGGEIISADSRQVYRGMDIGTGKVTKREQKTVPHHLLDVADPKRDFTVARYKNLAQKALRDIQKRGQLPIVVGGTGLYVDALLDRLSWPEVPPNKTLRKRLDKLGAQQLFALLRKLDPRRAANIDRHNKRRLIRALEIVLTTGKPVPKVESEKLKVKSNHIIWVGINPEKETLVRNIKKRLDARLRPDFAEATTGKQGTRPNGSAGRMIQEVKKLHRSGVSWKRLENFGLEYRWIARYVQEKISKQEMYDNLLRDSIHYSKRQMTWFKRNKEIRWFSTPQKALRALRYPPALFSHSAALSLSL